MLFCVTYQFIPQAWSYYAAKEEVITFHPVLYLWVKGNHLLLQTIKSRMEYKRSLFELSLSHKIAIFSGHSIQRTLQSVAMKCLLVLHQVFLPVCGILTNITLEVFNFVMNRHPVLCQSVFS